MGNILDNILLEKTKEVERLRKENHHFQPTIERRVSLIQELESSCDPFAVIAEFKRSSPSKGVINTTADPVEQAQEYEKNGAAAISVLTDHAFFKGSYNDLRAIKQVVSIPVLCKDFIIDSLQIDRAAEAGADIILLIVAALDQVRLFSLYDYAGTLGLDVLVEVHNLAELERAFTINAKLIGINNRNLKTFDVSLHTTEELAPLVKKNGAFLISESGIFNQEDVTRVVKAGADGILVGESLMRSDATGNLLQKFQRSAQKGKAR